ncbi:hypothetical protein FHX37_0333 [Haloactinospora alba]|uniref:AAA domain-containing protein n=1 Tax=Haloactinospora alba TaxID=405555 RepID=A0A543NF45_9ACTN|nr:hypothetical protein [Haloactinospora alba]TQN30455.1 hypothetical protein FHX37_0333 [Haloactinospora alba]
MRETRVILLGGTSHTGKSTLARTMADRLGFTHRSTDGLARHPGRPWSTPGREVPAHVADHYARLSVDELVASVLDHYERLWPTVAELVAARARGNGTGTGLVLEGSAVLPARVAELAVPRTAAVWLTADDTVLRSRIHAESRYEDATSERQRLVDAFLARAARYQRHVVDSLDRLGLDRIDTGHARPVTELADRVLATVGGTEHGGTPTGR